MDLNKGEVDVLEYARKARLASLLSQKRLCVADQQIVNTYQLASHQELASGIYMCHLPAGALTLYRAGMYCQIEEYIHGG